MFNSIIFDVDDTLYDHLLPLKRSIEQSFPDIDKSRISDIYTRFRYWSDATFYDVTAGNISIIDARIFRCKQTVSEFGVKEINDEQCLLFQASYEKELQNIKMFTHVQHILDYLREKNIKIGIITNGPVLHQQHKLKKLHALDYFKEENIIISQATNYQKPQREIFDLAARKLGLDTEKTIYIGDTFKNDIEGAYKAGWRSIWFNHRKRTCKQEETQYIDYEVQSEQELYELITHIV